MTGKSTSYLKLGLCVALVGYVFLTAASIYTKLPWVDEALFASPAYSLVSKGYMGTSVMETAGTQWVGIDRHTYWTVPLHLLAQAGWYEVFGFGLFTMRALSESWGLMALAALYVIALRLSGDKRIAAVATALIALDCSFIAAASSGRMDMMNAALGMGGLATYLSLRERQLPVAVLAGHAFVCASGLTHPNGILYLAGLVFLMLYFDRQRLSWRHLGLMAAPYCIGAVGWGLYIRQDPGLFRAQFASNMRNGSRLSYLKAPWMGLWRELVHRYLGYFGLAPESTGLSRLKLAIPLIHAAGLAGLLGVKSLRRQPGYRALLVLTALPFGMLAVYDGQKLPYYLIHFVPLLDTILAVWIVTCWTKHSIPSALIGVVLIIFVSVQLLTSAQRIHQNPYHKSYLPAASYLQRNTVDKTLIMGSAALDFSLGFDGKVVDDPRLGYHSGKAPGLIAIGDADYKQYFESFEVGEPAVYRFIIQRLANEYHLVYDYAGQKIYARR